MGSVANKASHTNKARRFLACDPQKESLQLLKTFIKQLIMLPISPYIHRLGFLPLRKVLPKQNKKQKAFRERQIFSLSLECVAIRYLSSPFSFANAHSVLIPSLLRK